MTVKELIEILSKENQYTDVLINGYEGGYDRIRNISIKKVAINRSPQDYLGEYEDSKIGTIVIVIGW